MSAQVDITRCTGQSVQAIIADVAALRVKVFRDWPYLYDGDEAYEAAYLQTYLHSAGAAVIVARLDGQIVGASTCLPLTDETPNVQAPFLARGWALEKFFYFGESVLLPGLRGRGIGVAFFEAREAHAKEVSSCDFAGFCGVIRPLDDARRPAGFQPLDPFWRRRGFTPRPDLICQMAWKEIDQPEETTKDLQFWLKSLRGAPLP